MSRRNRYRDIDVGSLPRSYVSYDLETTGLGADARIVEIGAVRVIDGYEDEKFDTFVAPPAGVCFEPGARAVNHISDAMLEGAPAEASAYRDFAAFAEDLPLVGQNIVAFDNPLLDAAAARAGERPLTANGCHDTMLLYRALVGMPASLAAICAHYGVQNPQAHRAWADAVATSDCYLAILRDAASRAVHVRDLAERPASGELAGERVCFTGNSYDFPKRDMEVLALEHGAELRERVTKRVTMLVALEDRRSGKVMRAEELGVPVVGAEAFLERIGLAPADLRREPPAGRLAHT